MDSPSFDVIVVGAGPAGLATATEVARAGLKVFCLDKLAPGGALINLAALHDIKEGSNGPHFASRIPTTRPSAGVELGFGEVVRLAGAGPLDGRDGRRRAHTGRAIVVATGLPRAGSACPKKTSTKAAASRIAPHCDGPLYSGLPVSWRAPAAGPLWKPGNSRRCERDHDRSTPGGGHAGRRVQRMEGRIVGLEGSDGLQSVIVETAGTRKTIPTSAVFVYVGQSPAAEFLPDSLARDATGPYRGRCRGPHLDADGVRRRRRAGRRTLLSGRRHRRRPARRASPSWRP